jgi:hypothetical protein
MVACTALLHVDLGSIPARSNFLLCDQLSESSSGRVVNYARFLGEDMGSIPIRGKTFSLAKSQIICQHCCSGIVVE